MGRLANVTVGKKLVALGGVGVVAALVVGASSLVSLSAVSEAATQRRDLAKVESLLNHLDTRTSELKVDAYRALLEGGDELLPDAIEDVQTVVDVWTEIDAKRVPDDIAADLGPAKEQALAYGAFIEDYVRAVAADPEAASRDMDQIRERENAMEELLDVLNEEVDAELARMAAHTDSLVARSRTAVIAVLLVGLVLAGLLWRIVSRSITVPLDDAVGVLQAMAAGDLRPRATVAGRDEVGQLGTALNRSLDDVTDAIRAIGESSMSLGAASEELSAVAAQLGMAADQTASQAGSVSAAAEEVSSNVGTVATGTEELSASIREISGSTAEAARVATSAVTVADAAGTTVSRLSDSSTEIGDVVKVINGIAEQTNLLALNATIEAARAGEAGKGFAVVANEVKELAKETTKATEDIGRKVQAIQADSGEVVGAIDQIGGVIASISDLQSTIASAVEEQTATTSEIGRSVAEAATGSNEIAATIAGVAGAAAETSSGADSALQAAGELAALAERLSALVARFTVTDALALDAPGGRHAAAAEPVAERELTGVR
jgi:methyl-accepting chemotaxis protein